jgi:GntR family transcriptional regulator/MocR family aminotransferase
LTEYLFQLPDHQRGTLQARIQEMLVNSILEGHLEPDAPLPSSRKLARQLSVARNTVVYAYQNLVDEGFLVSRERSGFFVNGDILKGRVQADKPRKASVNKASWEQKLVIYPGEFRQNNKPANWNSYPYPFICGQYDRQLFPIADWRECCREAAAISAIHDWAKDQIDQDNQELVDQIHKKLLPRRGVWAEPDEILVTLGAQQGIYLAAQLLLNNDRTMGFESPGYVDAENTFSVFTSKLKALNVDQFGLIPDKAFSACDGVYTTPSHQYPTTVTMPRERRQELLASATKHDMFVIEDDYESEFNYVGEPTPALKSMDEDGRVIYIGSVSKTLAPGIRLGYMVAPRELIDEARALRRLMMRHPPSNNQFIIAQFLKRGYHDSLINRLSHTLHQRWSLLGDLLDQHFPGGSHRPTFGGSAIWVEGDKELDSRKLLQSAKQEGILFEPGEVFFHEKHAPKHFFRIGFSSIQTEHIRPGIEKLMQLMKK